MTVIVYRLKQYSRRGQRIDTRLTGRKVRKRDRDNMQRLREVKLIASFLGKRWFPLAFSRWSSR